MASKTTTAGERFFIPLPTPTGKSKQSDPQNNPTRRLPLYRTDEGQELMWSSAIPLPAIGSRVWIRLNGIGCAEVRGYFESYGYLGVMTKAENPPEWLRKQDAADAADPSQPDWIRQGIGCEFGCEISLDENDNDCF